IDDLAPQILRADIGFGGGQPVTRDDPNHQAVLAGDILYELDVGGQCALRLLHGERGGAVGESQLDLVISLGHAPWHRKRLAQFAPLADVGVIERLRWILLIKKLKADQRPVNTLLSSENSAAAARVADLFARLFGEPDALLEFRLGLRLL